MKINDEFDTKPILSVGEIARRSGVAISAIHFYEEKGLIGSFRNGQNQRQYPRGILRVVSLIKAAQFIGFSLEEIQDMLKDLPIEEKPTETHWKKLAKRWEKELDRKIASLTKIKEQLNSCIGCGCLSQKDCPLRNQNDILGKKGPGAHLIR